MESKKKRMFLGKQWWCDNWTETGTETETETGTETDNWRLETGNRKLKT